MENKLLIIISISKEIKNKHIPLQRKLDLLRMRAFLNLEVEKYNSVITDANKCLDYFELFKKEKKISFEIRRIYNKSWIARIFIIRGIAYFKKGNKNNGTDDFIKAIEIYPKIINEKTYLIEKLPEHIRSTFKYLDALN